MSQSVTVPRQKCDDSNSEGSVPPLWPNWPVSVGLLVCDCCSNAPFQGPTRPQIRPGEASTTKSVGVDGFGQPISSSPSFERWRRCVRMLMLCQTGIYVD